MLELLSCDQCGKMVLIVNEGSGTLSCCGQPMTWCSEKTVDEGKEKHAPVVEKIPTGTRIKVGAVPHPMEADHHIVWIEVMGDTFLYTKTLKPGDTPESDFCIDPDQVKKVRIYCNKHGFWKKS
ncbi:MAG: desulfoferrodoxin [Methanomicrobiales archaeon]|nr:desulfoferrodoxin [Methanomicrobiales archaeon]